MDERGRFLEFCTYCPKMCRHTCPVSNATCDEALTPQSKMQLVNMLERGAVPWEEDYLRPAYGCTACGLCQKFCLHEVDVSVVLESARVEGERRRIGPRITKDLEQRFRSRNGRLLERYRSAFAPERFADEAQVGYFPGCDAIDSGIDDIHDVLFVLEHLGLDFVRLVDAPLTCAGYPLWAGGCTEGARQVATQLLRSLRRFSTVITGCAACTWLLRKRLPAEGFEHNIQVLHLSEFLYVHAERLDIQQTIPAAFYHDPCYLGRRLGIYDPPRRLLSRCALSVREFFYNREEAACCGGGGLVPLTYPEAAIGQARTRLAEAELFQVPVVVTACPTCKRTLQKTGTHTEVVDVIAMVARALKPPSRRRLRGSR